MHERPKHDEVEECIAYLEQCRQAFLDNGFIFPEDCELAIDMVASEHNEDVLLWYYYYVDHATRSVFWLRRRLLWKEIEDVRGAFSPDHICKLPPISFLLIGTSLICIQITEWKSSIGGCHRHRYRATPSSSLPGRRHIFHFPEGQRNTARHFGPHVWRKLLGSIDFDCLGVSCSLLAYSQRDIDWLPRRTDVSKKHQPLLPSRVSADEEHSATSLRAIAWRRVGPRATIFCRSVHALFVTVIT